jgi:hypothetical protein
MNSYVFFVSQQFFKAKTVPRGETPEVLAVVLLKILF